MSISIGIPVSLTGQFQVQGHQALAGLCAWARDANLISPGSFTIRFYDDESDRLKVREVTRRLIMHDRIDILVGPYSSVLTSAAAEVAEEHRKLLWNQGGASDKVYQRGYRNVVGILSPARRYLSELLTIVRKTDVLASSLAFAKASSGQFPREVCSGVLETAPGFGFNNVMTTEFLSSTQNFTSVVEDLKAAQPDVAVLVGRVHNDLALSESLAESDATAGTMVAVAAGIQRFWDHLGVLSEGFVGPSQWEPGSYFQPDFGPTSDQIITSLRADGYLHVDYPAAQGYAVGLIVQRCVEEAGSTDSAILREVAANIKFSTFYGDFQIDENTGIQIGRKTVLVQWQEGKKMIIWPPEIAQGSLRYPWR